MKRITIDFSEIIENSIKQNPELFKIKSDSVRKFKEQMSEIIPADALYNFHPEKEQRAYLYEKMIKYINDRSNSFYDRYCILSEAVGLKYKTDELAEIIISMLDETPENYSNKYNVWSLFDMLRSLGKKKYKDDYIRFANSDKFYSKDKQCLYTLFGRLKDEDYIKIIIDALGDENVNGHALSALEKYKDEKYDKYFEPFLNDKRKWVKKISKRRLHK